MPTTATTASIVPLTVKEIPSNTTVLDYSFVEALSDAGIVVLHDNDPQSQNRPKLESNIVYLWEAGCRMQDTWNCPMSCTNSPDMVWANRTTAMYTVQNCLIYPFLEYSAARDWLHEDSPGLLEKYGIALNTGKSIGATELHQGEWPAIGHCRQEMCRSFTNRPKKCEANPNNIGYWTRHKIGPENNLTHLQMYVDVHFCRLGWGTPNADIGGAGVSASYMQQLAIAIFGWAFLRLPELKYTIRKRLLPHMETRLEERLANFKARPSTAATVSALVGFQETQIFFSITLQIVCLITFLKSKLLMASSVVDLVANRFMFKVIGACCVFPVVLNLCTMRRNQATLDWFILIASSCCVLMAVASWSLANSLSFNPKQLSGSDSGPFFCGNTNPLMHCFGNVARDNIFQSWLSKYFLTAYNSVLLSEPALIVPLLVLAGLIATKYKTFRIQPYIRGDIFEWAVAKLPRETQRRHLKRVFHASVVILELWMVLTSVALLVAASLLMVPISQQGDPWTVGQIIAVAVWAPVLVNWLHLLYRGPQAGLDFQMANGYVVVRQPLETLGSMALLHARGGSSSKLQGDSHEGQPLDPLLGRASGRSSVSVPASLQPEHITGSQLDPSQSTRTSMLLNKSNTAPPA